MRNSLASPAAHRGKPPGPPRAGVLPADRVDIDAGGEQRAEQRHLRLPGRASMHQPRRRLEKPRLLRPGGAASARVSFSSRSNRAFSARSSASSLATCAGTAALAGCTVSLTQPTVRSVTPCSGIIQRQQLTLRVRPSKGLVRKGGLWRRRRRAHQLRAVRNAAPACGRAFSSSGGSWSLTGARPGSIKGEGRAHGL
jgi:hypothetical protein